MRFFKNVIAVLHRMWVLQQTDRLNNNCTAQNYIESFLFKQLQQIP
jgi:hypothetical protein